MPAGKTRYRVLTGLNYPAKGGEKRAERGDVVTDLPATSVGWLLERGHIETAESAGPEDGE